MPRVADRIDPVVFMSCAVWIIQAVKPWVDLATTEILRMNMSKDARLDHDGYIKSIDGSSKTLARNMIDEGDKTLGTLVGDFKFAGCEQIDLP